MKIKSRFISKTARVCLAAALLAQSVQAGSLWREGVTEERGMFADKRAKRVGDIVTIVVNETATLTNTLALTTNKESKSGVEGVVSSLVNQFVAGLPGTLLGKKFSQNAAHGTVPPLTPPSLSTQGSSSYTGGGTINNTQTITARAAVQVIDVLPNGNLVIEGVREISFSKEKQFVSLHGIVRPYDIQPDNTVASSNVADAQVQVVSEGTLTDAQKKGWLLRLNDKVNPF
jgi:flagellar L-ring protein precursor FlgH